MKKNMDIEKIVKAIMTDARFQDCVVAVITEMFEAVARSEQASEAAPALTAEKAPMAASQPKPRKQTDWTKSTNNSLRTAHSWYTKNGKALPDALHAELIKRFPTYDADLRTFTGRMKKQAKTPKQTPAPVAEVVPVAPKQAPARRAVATPRVTTTVAKPKTAPSELHVTIKMEKMTLTDVYNTVLVNGKPILKNHVNTELHSFLDGALLGVYGIVTTDRNLPKKPLWIIFNTNLEPNRFVVKDKYSGYDVYIKSVKEEQTQLRAEISNRATLFLEREKYTRLAAGRHFIIDEKTK